VEAAYSSSRRGRSSFPAGTASITANGGSSVGQGDGGGGGGVIVASQHPQHPQPRRPAGHGQRRYGRERQRVCGHGALAQPLGRSRRRVGAAGAVLVFGL